MGWAARTKAGAIRFPDAQERAERKLAWKIIDTTVSAIPDAFYPHDPAVVRAIREFDKNVFPCFGKRIYQSNTGGIREFGFHMITSVVRDPHYRIPSWATKVLLPTTGPVIRPTHSDMHIIDGRARRGDGLPGIGAYLPFDWRVYRLLREMWQENTPRELARLREKVESTRQRDRDAAEERAEYQLRTNKNWLARKIANISQADLGELHQQQVDAEKKERTR